MLSRIFTFQNGCLACILVCRCWLCAPCLALALAGPAVCVPLAQCTARRGCERGRGRVGGREGGRLWSGGGAIFFCGVQHPLCTTFFPTNQVQKNILPEISIIIERMCPSRAREETGARASERAGERARVCVHMRL